MPAHHPKTHLTVARKRRAWFEGLLANVGELVRPTTKPLFSYGNTRSLIGNRARQITAVNGFARHLLVQ